MAAGTGQVDHVTVTAGGTGYGLTPPTVAFTGGTALPGLTVTPPTALAMVSAGAVIAVVLQTPGANYATPPAVAFTGAGTGAAATAVLGLPSYATVAQLRAYLKQVAAGTDTDLLLQDVLDRATDTINSSDVGLGFAFAGYQVEARPVPSTYGLYLPLPPHAVGSVSSISLYGRVLQAGTDYQIVGDPDGAREEIYWLYLAGGTTTSTFFPTAPPTFGRSQYYNTQSGFGQGLHYDIVAAWGYGYPPPAVVEVCLELAVNIWASRTAGRFTNIVGTPGQGAVGYEQAMTPSQKAILRGVAARYSFDSFVC